MQPMPFFRMGHLFEEDQVLEIALARQLTDELFYAWAARSGHPSTLDETDVGLA
jgi:hypothetical protein